MFNSNVFWTLLILASSLQVQCANMHNAIQTANHLKVTASRTEVTKNHRIAAQASAGAAVYYQQAGMLEESRKMHRLAVKEYQVLADSAMQRGDHYWASIYLDQATKNSVAAGDRAVANELRDKARHFSLLGIPLTDTTELLLQAAKTWEKRAKIHSSHYSHSLAAECFINAAECYTGLGDEKLSRHMYLNAAQQYETLAVQDRDYGGYQDMKENFNAAAECYFKAKQDEKGSDMRALAAIDYSVMIESTEPDRVDQESIFDSLPYYTAQTSST